MHKNFFIYLIITIWSLVIPITASGQEIPIATGNDNTYAGGGAFDGTNFLFAIMGDSANQYSVTAQLVSSTGSLIGSRISLGKTGSGLLTAFDGTNFFIVWTDSFPMFAGGDTNGIGNLYGQFISTSGKLVGTTITIATGINSKFGKGRGDIIFKDTTYLVTYLKGIDHHTDYLYGQRIGKSGILLGAPVKISTDYAREFAIAFDGTNYLAAWCKVDHPLTDKDIYGQFISLSGTLVGQNFLIDGSNNASDNPVTMTFDGSRYLIAFHDQAADTMHWNLFGRFVTSSGTVAERFMICDSTKNPTYAMPVFDGTNYLITWMSTIDPMSVMGRFFSTSGIPIGTAFTVFETQNGKFPMGGVGGFGEGKYLLGATRIDPKYSDADVYIMFLDPLKIGAAAGKMNDFDGNIYATLKIGNQTWMIENLRVTHYRNGDTIGTTYPDTLDISLQSSPKYQWIPKGEKNNADPYGRLYTWYAAMDSRGLAPEGWHIPTTEEWTQLETYLIDNGFGYGGSGNDIAKSMAAASAWWTHDTTGTIGKNLINNNMSGFSALPAGVRFHQGHFEALGGTAYWWTSTQLLNGYVWSRNLDFNLSYLNQSSNYFLNDGFAIRCVKDTGPVEVNNETPMQELKSFSLNQNYPNPFNPSTEIYYELPKNSYVTLKVYDLLGKEVARLVDDLQQKGNHSVRFNAKNFSSGVYFYTLRAENFVQTRKMVLLR